MLHSLCVCVEAACVCGLCREAGGPESRVPGTGSASITSHVRAPSPTHDAVAEIQSLSARVTPRGSWQAGRWQCQSGASAQWGSGWAWGCVVWPGLGWGPGA
eukprot:1866115-Prymnesium_polylepis.1